VKIEALPQPFTVCKVHDCSGIDLSRPFCFIGKTDDECSLVCETEHVPEATLSREDGWRAFRIVGVLDFSLVGILSRVSSALASAKIGIFAVSTYNTDYVLVKEEHFTLACGIASEALKGIDL